MDSDWLLGRLGRQSGLLPASYVTIIEPLSRQVALDDVEQSVSDLASNHVIYHMMSCDNRMSGRVRRINRMSPPPRISPAI